jgi:hypothetical protein
MKAKIQKDDFGALLKLIRSFPEVGKIVIGSSNDGTSPPIATENEHPSMLREIMKKRFPNWHIYKTGDPIIHKNTGFRVLPLELQN